MADYRCVVCPPDQDGSHHPRDPDVGLCCRRAAGRMAGALRAIPELAGELTNVGYVMRDVRLGERTVLDEQGRRTRIPAAADPPAHALPAGPLNAPQSGQRVTGSPAPTVPLSVDVVDLLAPARAGSVAVHARSRWPFDQIGHLSIATELDFWVRDWADLRGEHLPVPTVPVLAGWLADRLDWACRHHLALDEFAAKVGHLHGALLATTGQTTPRREERFAPCRTCHTLGLWWDPDLQRVVCPHCTALMTDTEYADYARSLTREAACDSR